MKKPHREHSVGLFHFFTCFAAREPFFSSERLTPHIPLEVVRGTSLYSVDADGASSLKVIAAC
jgi:hypothetical protein